VAAAAARKVSSADCYVVRRALTLVPRAIAPVKTSSRPMERGEPRFCTGRCSIGKLLLQRRR
jgi:hypothetical protein